MRHRATAPLVALATPLALALLALAAPAAGASAAPTAVTGQVAITNFPEVQQISGQVTIDGPVPATRFLRRPALVTPAALADTTHLTEAAVVDTAGFSQITLSLGGALRGSAAGGAVGVVLIPELPEVAAALTEAGLLQFPLRVEAGLLPAAGGRFSSDSVTFQVAFPRYRVLFYNSTPAAADATLYVLLGTR